MTDTKECMEFHLVPILIPKEILTDFYALFSIKSNTMKMIPMRVVNYIFKINIVKNAGMDLWRMKFT